MDYDETKKVSENGEKDEHYWDLLRKNEKEG